MFFVTIVSGKFSKSIDDNFHSDTILQLKQSINNHCGIPINLIKLFYKGVQLNDNKRISDYFIQSYDKIDLELKLLEIHFSKSENYGLKWYVEEGTTVAELKRRIFGKIYGIIFGKQDDYILKDGDMIILT